MLWVPMSRWRGTEQGDRRSPKVDLAHGAGLKHSQTLWGFSFSTESRRCRGAWVAQANMGGTETAGS